MLQSLYDPDIVTIDAGPRQLPAEGERSLPAYYEWPNAGYFERRGWPADENRYLPDQPRDPHGRFGEGEDAGTNGPSS